MSLTTSPTRVLRVGRCAAAFCLFGDLHRVVAPVALDAGSHSLALAYARQPSGGGPVTLSVGGATVAELLLPEDLPFRWQIGGAGLRIGHDTGFPVCDDYRPPFPFKGTIDHLAVESAALAPRPARRSRGDVDAEVEHALRHE